MNVLIRGHLGTGETEFARMPARELDKNLFEVNHAEKEESRWSDEVERFAYHKVCQKFLAGGTDTADNRFRGHPGNVGWKGLKPGASEIDPCGAMW